MIEKLLARTLLTAIVAAHVAAPALADPDANVHYPETRTVEVVDVYHGTEVADPYRWLEDQYADDVADWVKSQNEVTFAYLENLPAREAFEERLTELWDYAKMTAPFRVGDRYFFYRNDGLQNQSVLFVQEGRDGEPRVLLDPNQLSEDGTVALGSVVVNDQATMLAYSVSESGSDWRSWHVRNIETGEDLPDVLRNSKFSGASWLPDGSGFYYCAYPVLPPSRRRPGGRPAGLRSPRTPQVGVRRFGHRRRTVPGDQRLGGLQFGEPDFLRAAGGRP
jgi:hypothetical protein